MKFSKFILLTIAGVALVLLPRSSAKSDRYPSPKQDDDKPAPKQPTDNKSQ